MSKYFASVLVNILALCLCVSALNVTSVIRGKKVWPVEKALDYQLVPGQVTGIEDVSGQCRNDITIYAAGLIDLQEWAWRMLDADGERLDTGGPPPGVLDGHTHWVGSWEECMRVKSTNQSVIFPDRQEIMYHDWDAKYCRCRFGPRESITYSFGVCVPSTCNETDVSHMFHTNVTGPIYDVYCGKDLDFSKDAGAITTTVILCLIGTVILVATLVDYVLSCRKKTADSGGVEMNDIQRGSISKKGLQSSNISQEDLSKPISIVCNGHVKYDTEAINKSCKDREGVDGQIEYGNNEKTSTNDQNKTASPVCNGDLKHSTQAGDVLEHLDVTDNAQTDHVCNNSQPDEGRESRDCDGDIQDVSLFNELSLKFVETEDRQTDYVYSNKVEISMEELNEQAQQDCYQGDEYIKSKDSAHKFKGTTWADTDWIGETRHNKRSLSHTLSINEHKTATGKGLKTLSAFSLLRNVPRMLLTSQPKGTYTCINGVRLLAMFWVVLGHSWQFGIFVMPDDDVVTLENQLSLFNLMDGWSNAVINNMSVAVDSFFLLSGCLVTITLMKQFDRLKRDKSSTLQVTKTIGLYYFHRYWRLTPVYAIVIMIYSSYFHYLEQGPLWTKTIADVDNCKELWWTNLLYINNLVYVYDVCMGWSWYLANDFQFYLCAPIFVVFLFRFPIFGCILLAFGYAGQLFATAWILDDMGNRSYYFDYYIRPWCRFGPYAVGIALGFILFHTKCKVKLPKWGVALGWILATVLCILAVYGNHMIDEISCEDCTWVKDLKTAYLSLYRDIYAVGIAWLVFACCTGYGGLVNSFLSWKGFVPLSRLTYAGYLVHPIIIYYTMFSRMRMFYIQTSIMVVFFCGYLLLTFGAAFVFSLLFEVPMLELEKVWLPRK